MRTTKAKKPSEYVLGIDPGQKGGVAILNDGVVRAERLRHIVMADGRRMPDPLFIERMLWDWQPRIIAIEHQRVMNTGRKASFTLGLGYGAIMAVIHGMRMQGRLAIFRPIDWQQALFGRVKRGETKAKALGYAADRYGYETTDDGIADAICIATHAKERDQ